MSKQKLSESLVIDMVQDCRRQLPRLGGKKVYSMIKSELDQLPVSIGRDKLFRILKKIRPNKFILR